MTQYQFRWKIYHRTKTKNKTFPENVIIGSCIVCSVDWEFWILPFTRVRFEYFCCCIHWMGWWLTFFCTQLHVCVYMSWWASVAFVPFHTFSLNWILYELTENGNIIYVCADVYHIMRLILECLLRLLETMLIYTVSEWLYVCSI